MADPAISRRAFVKSGGALIVWLSLPPGFGRRLDAASVTTPDATTLASWLEIHADGTILARTGRTETGTGMISYYTQVIAEELNVRPETISLVLGDTDKTPDGGFSAGFALGAANVRKVAAYTYQALLGLAATRLDVPVSSLTVTNGVVRGGGKSVTYAQLVEGQELNVTIPITGNMPRVDPKEPWGIAGAMGLMVGGNPPTKPIDQYTVVGTSHPMPTIPDQVTGKTVWAGDVTVPGMLHARMVRPSTLGSTLVSAGTVDTKRFPTAQIVRKANLLAVVSPNEWEAVAAARMLAQTTKWTEWAGLPGSENLTAALRAHKWSEPSRTRGNAPAVQAALAAATKTIAATYEQPYTRHAPIGPFVALADVRADGTITVWSNSANPQALRAHIAHMLGMSPDNVIVRWLAGAGQYGRVTQGGDGAEGDAVILSQLLGKPVRVQWSLQEDMAWSTMAPGWVSDLKAAVDDQGNLTALQSAWYSPHHHDVRMLGAILAGLPTTTPAVSAAVRTVWPYDRIPNVLEQTFVMPNIAADAPSNVGLRGNIMRTPWQRQQNFALEALMNEAAASADVDPIEYRLRHTSDRRMIELLNETAKAAQWEWRSSPHPRARTSGSTPVVGRGVAVMIRAGAYWVGIADIEVTPATGAIRVTQFTLGVEPGKIINPKKLESCMRGGVVQGLGEALKEEVTFDKSKITNTDWRGYRILTMQEMPDIRIVQLSRDEHGIGTGGEAPNALPPPAVTAAFFDATGVRPRRIPLTPRYVRSLLSSGKEAV